jgi:hypothetical protein
MENDKAGRVWKNLSGVWGHAAVTGFCLIDNVSVSAVLEPVAWDCWASARTGCCESGVATMEALHDLAWIVVREASPGWNPAVTQVSLVYPVTKGVY